MKDRALLLAGLVEEDDLENVRYSVVESVEEQMSDDRKFISENVSFVEEDDQRLSRLIGESEEEPEWEGSKKLNENIAMGGYGPGFAGAPSYALSSRYTPSQQEVFGQIAGTAYHQDSQYGDLDNPKVALFQKIAEMNPGAFDLPLMNEDEMPEFDENFNPIIKEDEDIENFFSDQLMEKEEGLSSKLHNGELAVMGGIGPGFESYDGVKKEIKNPYESAESMLEKWYLGEGSMDFIKDDSQKQKYDFGKFLFKKAKNILSSNEFQMNIDELASRLGLNLDDENEHELMYEIIQMLYPEYEMIDMKDSQWIVGTDKLLDQHLEESDNWGDGWDEDWKEQPDLPGEVDDMYEDMPDIHDPRWSDTMPKALNLANMNLNYVGKDGEYHIYQIDGDDAMVGVAKDVEGWYAQVRDAVLGLMGEGEGDSPTAAIENAVKFYSGNQQEMPPSLMETVEGTDGNPWYYRRTGTADGYHLRYDEDKPTMHPEAPEEPSSKGHPGLKGWEFYDVDHTYQKMKAQRDDVLDNEEADAEEQGVGISLKELFQNK